MGFVVLQGLPAEPVHRCQPEHVWSREAQEVRKHVEGAPACRITSTLSEMQELPWSAAMATKSMFVTRAL